MRIQRVAHTDERLRALHKRTLPSDRPPTWSDGWWWIAFDDAGEPVGFCGLQPSVRWLDCIYLCRAGVVPSARGKGLQRRLISVRLRFARAMGMRWAVTDTFENPASSNNLIRCGFMLYEPSRPWGYKGALYWRRKVSA